MKDSVQKILEGRIYKALEVTGEASAKQHASVQADHLDVLKRRDIHT